MTPLPASNASHLDQKHSEEEEIRQEMPFLPSVSTHNNNNNDNNHDEEDQGSLIFPDHESNISTKSNNSDNELDNSRSTHELSTNNEEEIPTSLEIPDSDVEDRHGRDDRSDSFLSSDDVELAHDEGSAHFRDHDVHNPFVHLGNGGSTMASISNSSKVPGLTIVKRVGYFRDMSYAGGFVLTVIIFLCLTIYDSLQPPGTYWVNADQSHWQYLHMLWAASAFSFIFGYIVLYIHMRYCITRAELHVIQPVSALLFIVLGATLPEYYHTINILLFLLAAGGTIMAINLRSRVDFSAVMLDAGRQLLDSIPRLERLVRMQLCVQLVWVSIWCWLFTGTLATSQSHADGIAKASFMLFVLGWTTQVIHAIVLSNTCGLVAAKLVLDDEVNIPTELASLRRRFFARSITSSFGSLCAGALLGWVGDVAVALRGPSFLLEEKLMPANHHHQPGRRHWLMCLCCCLNPSELISRVLKHSNPYGWARVALRGSPYHVASRDTWQVFQKTGVEVATQDDATSRLLWFLPQISGTLTVLLGVWHLSAEHHSALVPLIVALAMVGASGVTVGAAPFAASVRTIYVCFAENPDHLHVPYPIICHRLSRVAELSHFHDEQIKLQQQVYLPVHMVDFEEEGEAFGKSEETEEDSLAWETAEI